MKGIPVLSIAIVAAQAATAWQLTGNAVQAASRFASFYTALDPATTPTPQFQNLLIGWGPWIIKGVASRVARSVGARPRLFPGLSLS